MAKQPASSENPTVAIWLQPTGHVVAALLLSVPTALLGHTLAFGLAQVGDAVGPYPTVNLLYSVGEGLAASVCFGLFLIRLSASATARMWCWLAAFVLWVGAMPAWGILLGGEMVHCVLIGVLWASALLMWLAWLPCRRSGCLRSVPIPSSRN